MGDTGRHERARPPPVAPSPNWARTVASGDLGALRLEDGTLRAQIAGSRVTDEAELRAAWTVSVGSSPAAMAAFDDVVGRHRQPHRRYHGVRHVTWVVRHVNELAAEVPVADQGAIVAAGFFHDAVYDPLAADNEEASATMAERVLDDLGWPQDRGRRVGALIRATERHEPAGDGDGDVLVDADLAVLGSEPSAYQAYVTGVRTEYGHLDEATWRAGRSAVLRSLLDRDPIYRTAAGRRRWEARARANVTAELAMLGAPR